MNPTQSGCDAILIQKQQNGEKIKYVFTPGLHLPETTFKVFEQIEGGKFLFPNGGTTTQIPSTIDNEEIFYVPIPKNKIGWNLCSSHSGITTQPPLPYEDKNELTDEEKAIYKEEWIKRVNTPETPYWNTEKKANLWQQIRNFIYAHLELPDDRQYDVLTAWIFACWIPERWDTVPYVFFFGPMASGKTRALATLQYLAYRSNFSISCSPAALFRTIEKYNVIPFLDEAEVYNSEDSLEIIACLNAGYKRESGFVQRFQGDCENGDVVNFRVFGFKAIAGTDKIKNTLESRSVIIRMARNTRDVNVFIKKKWAQKIRDDLLQWRFWALQNLQLPNIETGEAGEDSEDVERGCIPPEFMEMHNSRVIELFLPLYFVSDGETRQAIINYAKNVYEDQNDEESCGEEAEIIRAISLCKLSVENNKLKLQPILDIINETRGPREQFGIKRISNIIQRMGFKKTRTQHGYTGILWNEALFKKMEGRYFPPASPASPASLTTTTPTPSTSDKPYFSACYFCGKPIYEVAAVFSSFTENKPSHQACFDQKQAELKPTKPETPKILSIEKHSAEDVTYGVCNLCKLPKQLTHQINYEGGNWAETCSECALKTEPVGERIL